MKIKTQQSKAYWDAAVSNRGKEPAPTEHHSNRKETQYHAAAAAESLQSCPTLCDPRDGSTPGSPVPGILQARTLEWVAISFPNA